MAFAQAAEELPSAAATARELRQAGADRRRRSPLVSDIEAGNQFLPGFLVRFNERFAAEPREPASCAQHRNQPA